MGRAEVEIPRGIQIAVLELVEKGDILSCPCDVDKSVISENMNQSGSLQDMKLYGRVVTDDSGLELSVTTPGIYPLSNVVVSIDNLGYYKIFSVVDLTSAYHQIEVNSDDQAKTSFITKTGVYKYVRLPYGQINGPATFQKLMNSMIRGLRPTQCMVYIDDFIIFSKVMEQHVDHLRSVFDRLEKANISLFLDKCNFAVSAVHYLGHVIGSSGVSPDPKFIETVQLYPSPSNVKELQSFLGSCNNYHGFISSYATIARPLTSLLKKGIKFVWTDKCEQSFIALKKALTTSPVLAYPDFSKPFILATDASQFAIGSVLSQVVNVIDHAALKWMLGLKDPSGRLMHWFLQLSEYVYKIQHRPGRKHGDADCMSRRVRSTEASAEENMSAEQQNDECQLFRQQSKYLVMKPLPDETAETIAQTFVLNWMLKFGVPDSIITDQGTNFVSELMTQLYQLLHVKKTYNSQVHTSTQLNPYEVVHGMKMSTPYEHLTVPSAVGNSHVVELARKLCNVWKSVKQHNHAAFLQQAAQYNKKAVNGQYKVGDHVYLSNPELKKSQVKKFQQDWKGPYLVIEIVLAGDHVNCLQPRLVKKKTGPSATTIPDPTSARTYRKAAKVSPPNSPSTPPIPYNLCCHHQ
ncbi:hypothetical protein PR048_021604 [Dryococelus australis]|uniref:Reverse transcriptase domain-containing protein n=1 Tax=Dryococelus australis TaxID=614101 RepID=A0ABQ9GYQ9_9NEOP|nr:hypothetical protein PR048_021604 [Dryococelus australis]